MVVVVRPTAAGALSSTATVASGVFDPAMADNTASTAVTVEDTTPSGDAVGPKVVDLRRFGFLAQPTSLVLTFSEDLNAARATDLANYRLIARGRDGRFDTRDDVRLVLNSAVYDPVAHTVTLAPRQRIPLFRQFRLVVNGTSPRGITEGVRRTSRDPNGSL